MGEIIAIIKHLDEKNIWHEIAHLIGAADHYEEVDYQPKKICQDDECIMRYGRIEGKLCKRSLEEIDEYIKNNKLTL